MRILFILPHPIEGPSSRFRVYQYIPYLRQHGIECEIRPFVSSSMVHRLYGEGNVGTKALLTLTGLASRLTDVVRATRYDVVFILREAFALGPPLVEHALTLAGGRMVFDFDDAIYMSSLAYQNPIDRLRDFNKPAKVIGAANTIVPGSAYLANFANQHKKPDAKVEILPTVVDHHQYLPRTKFKDEKHVTLGWIGTPRGSHYVSDLMPVFERLCIRFKNLRMVFIGTAPFDTKGLPIELRRWSLERETADIAEFDIGIMPLTDDEETRGKCGFKLIQYMSSGVAPVASPVGANNEIITDGETGLFAQSDAQWEEKIATLIEEKTLRNQITEAGRQRVSEHYCLDVTAPRFMNILQETANR